ncbi:MAG: tetratricopeptide repeat protein [Ignavibacteria bacterium]|jgi:tetratricopeptide (TPR) repeat protein
MKKRKLIIRGLIIFYAVYCVAAILFAFSFDSPQEFINYLADLFKLRTYEVTFHDTTIPAVRKPVNTVSIDEIHDFRKLFLQRNFKTLNEKLNSYQEKFEEDFNNEDMLFDAFNSFEITLPLYKNVFEEWIEFSPSDYQPYLARAFYYFALGWQSRGHKFAGETTDEQFSGMHFNFQKALNDINKSLEIKENLMPAYYLLISIANASMPEEDEDSIVEEAVKLFPYSYTIWSSAIHGKLPRWGGSYIEMEYMAKSAEKYVKLNPWLYSLYGKIYADQADIFYRNDEYNKAIEFYTKALEFGGCCGYYTERARVYAFGLEDSLKAFDDINKAIQLCRTSEGAYILRSRMYLSFGDVNNSLNDLYTAQNIKPNNSLIQSWKESASEIVMYWGHKHYNDKDYNTAIFEYNQALRFYSDNAEVYYWRGNSNYNLKKFDMALNDFVNAVEKDPHYFEAYRMIDYTKSLRGDWKSIIAYWNRFLRLEPDHAEALLERAGTYYHLGDYQNSLNDLKKSCELGNDNACARYKEMKTKPGKINNDNN